MSQTQTEKRSAQPMPEAGQPARVCGKLDTIKKEVQNNVSLQVKYGVMIVISSLQYGDMYVRRRK